MIVCCDSLLELRLKNILTMSDCCRLVLLSMMMMILCLKAGSLAFTPPEDEMSEVASHCPPHRQLWVSNLSKVATQWLEVDLNLQPRYKTYRYTTTVAISLPFIDQCVMSHLSFLLNIRRQFLGDTLQYT